MTAAGRRRRSALACDCGGSAALEFGLMVLPLLAFLFGIIEAGRLLWIQNALHYAVEAAARCASIDTIVCDNARLQSMYIDHCWSSPPTGARTHFCTIYTSKCLQ